MNRRSLIKSILTIAVAPKILSKLELNTPLIQPKEEEFIGIIPSIMSANNIQNYEIGDFTIEDFVRIYNQTGNMLWSSGDK